MKIIDLFYNIMTNEKVPQKIKYHNKIWELDTNKINGYFDYINCDNRGMTVFFANYLYSNPNDEVEILEEEKELHANDIEFNINNDKRDCIITLDENDLGIDKLHLDNCYFYKENDKWYVKKYDFKSFKLEEEKKIPEPQKDILHIDDLITPVDENMYKIWIQTIKNHNKINEICDYLKSKGE